MPDEHTSSLRDMGEHYRQIASQLREIARHCRYRTGRSELVQLAAKFEYRAERADHSWR